MNRNEHMKALRKQGLTLQAIGDKYGVSRERVRQIVDDVKAPGRSIWLIASHKSRRTCYICRNTLHEVGTKFCKKCVTENKLNGTGRDVGRGVVRGRDNNTCQVCGYKWNPTQLKRLDVHHLDGLCGELTKKYDRPDSYHKLITVCHKCHYNLHDHRKYGTRAPKKRLIAKF